MNRNAYKPVDLSSRLIPFRSSQTVVAYGDDNRWVTNTLPVIVLVSLCQCARTGVSTTNGIRLNELLVYAWGGAVMTAKYTRWDRSITHCWNFCLGWGRSWHGRGEVESTIRSLVRRKALAMSFYLFSIDCTNFWHKANYIFGFQTNDNQETTIGKTTNTGLGRFR